jgi:hypothetical protein
MNKIQDLARVTSDRVWRVTAEKARLREQRQQERLETRGTYQSYDADQERHQVKLGTGQFIDAQSITNAGLAAGDEVVISGRGANARIKTMPR